MESKSNAEKQTVNFNAFLFILFLDVWWPYANVLHLFSFVQEVHSYIATFIHKHSPRLISISSLLSVQNAEPPFVYYCEQISKFPYLYEEEI